MESDPDESFRLPGYNLFRLDRVGKTGGGVAVYVREEYSVKVINSSEAAYSNKPEFLLLEISAGTESLLFGVVYSRPGALYPVDLFEVLSAACPNYKSTVITGDFNTNLLVKNHATRFLLSNLSALSLSVVPSEPTHHVMTENQQSHTWLDLFLVSSLESVSAYKKSDAPFIAGHDLIEISFGFPCLERRKFEYMGRNLGSVDSILLNKRVAERSVSIQNQLNDNSLRLRDSIDMAVRSTTNILIDELNTQAPLKLISVKSNRKPWVSQDIKLKMRARDRAYRIAVNTGRASDVTEYRRLRNEVSNDLDTARIDFIAGDLDRSTDSRSRWAALRRLGLSRQSLPSPLKMFTAGALLRYYSTISGVGTALDTSDISDVLKMPLDSSKPVFSFSDVSSASVSKYIMTAKSRSTGPDGISVQALKMASRSLASPLASIINFSLNSSIFPTDWKRAYLCPLAKVRHMSSPCDTRPIAKLCEPSKLLEKAVHEQLLNFLTENELLCRFQSGFRPGHNTQTALLNILEDVREAVDRRRVTALLLFDFSKAFDSVPHHLLLRKLRRLNCDDRVILWFASYLSRRFQTIHDESTGRCESWVEILMGVPQGSVLGPLLFSIFINDLPSALTHSKYALFADDFQIYFSFYPECLTEAFNCINMDIDALVHWSELNGLRLNADKTQAIVLGSLQYVTRINAELERPDCPSLFVSGSKLVFSEYVKNLGVIIDQTLCWDRQVSATVSRVHNTLRSLRLYRRALNRELRKELVETLIFPIFDYCCLVYDDLNQQQNLRLHRALNACVRLVFGFIGYRERVTPYRLELGWLSVASRRKYFLATSVFSILSSGMPDYLASRFTRIDLDVNVRQSSRRPPRVLVCPPLRTNTLKQSFVNSGTRLINDMSGTLDEIQLFNGADVLRFKAHTHDFLLGLDRGEWMRELATAH